MGEHSPLSIANSVNGSGGLCVRFGTRFCTESVPLDVLQWPYLAGAWCAHTASARSRQFMPLDKTVLTALKNMVKHFASLVLQRENGGPHNRTYELHTNFARHSTEYVRSQRWARHSLASGAQAAADCSSAAKNRLK